MVLVNYTGKNIFTFNAKGTEPIRLLPGINEIADKSWSCIQAHPFYNDFVAKGGLIVLNEPPKDKDGRRSVADLLAYIPNIMDSKLLKKLIEEDGRELVAIAARDQMDIIKGKKQKVEENEHFK